MNREKTVAGALMVTLSAAALGFAPHTQCSGQEEVIGCRHDGHIDQPEPEGPIQQAQQVSANGGSTTATSMPPGRFVTAMPIYAPDMPEYGSRVWGTPLALLAAST